MKKLSDIVYELIDNNSCQWVAGEIGVDPSTISRFRSGKVGLTIPQIQALITLAGYELVRSDTRKRFKETIAFLGGLLNDEIRFKKRDKE